jgi:hypothetical protein
MNNLRSFIDVNFSGWSWQGSCAAEGTCAKNPAGPSCSCPRELRACPLPDFITSSPSSISKSSTVATINLISLTKTLFLPASFARTSVFSPLFGKPTIPAACARLQIRGFIPTKDKVATDLLQRKAVLITSRALFMRSATVLKYLLPSLSQRFTPP